MTIQVAAAIIQKDGKILLAKRARHKHLAGYWEFPGGKIEQGETPQSCLVRELQEELQVKVESLRYLAEHTHDYETMTVTIQAFLCDFAEGGFVLTDHDEVKWVKMDELGDYVLAPADIPFISYLLK